MQGSHDMPPSITATDLGAVPMAKFRPGRPLTLDALFQTVVDLGRAVDRRADHTRGFFLGSESFHVLTQVKVLCLFWVGFEAGPFPVAIDAIIVAVFAETSAGGGGSARASVTIAPVDVPSLECTERLAPIRSTAFRKHRYLLYQRHDCHHSGERDVSD